MCSTPRSLLGGGATGSIDATEAKQGTQRSTCSFEVCANGVNGPFGAAWQLLSNQDEAWCTKSIHTILNPRDRGHNISAVCRIYLPSGVPARPPVSWTQSGTM